MMSNLFSISNIRLFILSVWMLFLELFLIRWISTEIRIFAYVNNLVLLACFVGIGLGCYFSNRRVYLAITFVSLTIIVIALHCKPFMQITHLLSGFSDSVIWQQTLKSDALLHAIKGVVLTIFMFSLIGTVFFPLGQLLGNMFNTNDKTIFAYSINVIGSTAGIWLFSLLSSLYTPPWVWFIVSACLSVVFIERKFKKILLYATCFIFSLVMIITHSNKSLFTFWSPYQKLEVRKSHIENIVRGYVLDVNNTQYMTLFDMSKNFVEKVCGQSQQLMDLYYVNQYELPYKLHKKAENLLIIGSGGGNDVAGALRQGIKEIDAVEIDPGIYKLGLSMHPEHPYQNQHVRIFIDDARAYFNKTRKKYDIVYFGLLDSHTTSSNSNNLRLDHYIYTLESFKQAKSMLKKDGILVVVFDAKRAWIALRIYGLLKDTFNTEPLTIHYGQKPEGLFGLGGLVYIAGNDLSFITESLNHDTILKGYVEKNTYPNPGSMLEKIKLTTDDWPYLYLESTYIPKMYICIIVSLLFLFLVGAGFLFKNTTRINFHFFFLGAAFMLLEFQNISKSALLFGSTWMVNAYMITAILLLILLANLFTFHFKIKNVVPFFYLLGASILIIYFIPLADLNIANYYLKATLIALFLNIPIFFAGVIFITSFQNYPYKDIALGSNLLGACVGGLMETLSFIVGIKALLICVFILYLFSFLSRRSVTMLRGN